MLVLTVVTVDGVFTGCHDGFPGSKIAPKLNRRNASKCRQSMISARNMYDNSGWYPLLAIRRCIKLVLTYRLRRDDRTGSFTFTLHSYNFVIRKFVAMGNKKPKINISTKLLPLSDELSS